LEDNRSIGDNRLPTGKLLRQNASKLNQLIVTVSFIGAGEVNKSASRIVEKCDKSGPIELHIVLNRFESLLQGSVGSIKDY